mgnify:CR=1 FL=1
MYICGLVDGKSNICRSDGDNFSVDSSDNDVDLDEVLGVGDGVDGDCSDDDVDMEDLFGVADDDGVDRNGRSDIVGFRLQLATISDRSRCCL